MISDQALMSILLTLNLEVHILLLLWRMLIKGAHVLFYVAFVWRILKACIGRLKLIACLGLTIVERIWLDILLTSLHGRWDRTVTCAIGLGIDLLSGLILHVNLMIQVHWNRIIVVWSTHAIRVCINSVLIIIRLIHVLIGLVHGGASDSRHVIPQHISSTIDELALSMLLGIVDVCLGGLFYLRWFHLVIHLIGLQVWR